MTTKVVWESEDCQTRCVFVGPETVVVERRSAPDAFGECGWQRADNECASSALTTALLAQLKRKRSK